MRHLFGFFVVLKKEKEKKLIMSFDEAHIPQYGEVILRDKVAEDLGVQNVGDVIYISIPINSTVIPLLSNYLNEIILIILR